MTQLQYKHKTQSDCLRQKVTARNPQHENFVWTQREFEREWCQKKAEFETSANPRKRLHSGGRKPLSTVLEDRVLEWIHDMRARGKRISRQAISKKGEIIWRELKSLNRTNVTAGSEDNEEISQQDF